MSTASKNLRAGPEDDWVRLIVPETRLVYYANMRNRQVSWSLPAGLVDEGPEEELQPLFVRLQNGWFMYQDPITEQPYFYHHYTQRTQWSMPAEARKADSAEYRASAFGALQEGDSELTDESGDDDGEYDDEDDDMVDEPDHNGAGRIDGDVRSPEDEEAFAAIQAKKRAARRLQILQEILESERTYVQALRTLKKVYLLPLKTVADLPSGKGQIFTHGDIDAVFINTELIIKVNEDFLHDLETELEQRRGDWREVQYGEIIKRGAAKFKGCYTRFVTLFDTAIEHLTKLKDMDAEKHRYLEVCKTHPDARSESAPGGLDLRSFLIQPVQRVPRYRMLLDDLLKYTDVDHADEAPLREALRAVSEVAMHMNEEKRHVDDRERMRVMVSRFANQATLEKELVSYERRLTKQGILSKIRGAKKQQRHVFLCNDLFLYAATAKGPSTSHKGFLLKGKIWLEGAHVESLPSTEHAPHAFAIIAAGGKGYTWLAETAAEQQEWYGAIAQAIEDASTEQSAANLRSARSMGRMDRAVSRDAAELLRRGGIRTLPERLEAVRTGSELTKYNQRDGKSSRRWVKVVGFKLMWGDVRSRDKFTSELNLKTALALHYGAKSVAFYKQGKGQQAHDPRLCFSIAMKERLFDFAADTTDVVVDWYLALSALMPHSSEPLLGEDELRARIEQMGEPLGEVWTSAEHASE